MLQLPIISLFLRTIPEGMLVVLLSYIILQKPLDAKKISMSGALLGLGTYVIRLFPIYFGVHMILILMTYIFLLHKVNEISLHKAVTASIFSFVMLIICDWAAAMVYIQFLGIPIEELLDQSLKSILLGWASLVLLACMSMGLNLFKKAQKRKVG